MATVTFKGKSIPLVGHIPSLHAKAREFSLTAKDLSDVSLKNFTTKYKILYTVPSLDTPVCMTSTKKFNQEIGKRSDTSLLIISADLPFAQTRVCGAENLENVICLSLMHSSAFAQDFGVLIGEGPLKGLCARAVFVLDQSNTIIYEEIVAEITQEPNYEKILALLK